MKKKIGLIALAVLGTLSLFGCTGNVDDNGGNNGGNTSNVIEGRTIYVSTTGVYGNTGTKDSPLPYMTAFQNAEAGDTLLFAAGTYENNQRVELHNNGKYNGYITVKPENEGDRVVFDFSEQLFASANRGIQIYGDYWHFQDVEVTGAGDNGMYVAGSYNIIENCLFYNNRDSGLQIGRAQNTDTIIDSWPSYNLIKNCTSFANYDAETYGENADGFAAKLTIGFGNVFDGCIAFRNSDDGWDLFAKEDSGNIGTVALYNCVSFENGYLPYQIERKDAAGETYMSYDTMNGDGIGFKLGGSTMEGDVILENCIAFNNKLHGFGDNSNPGVISIKNCTAYNNCMGLEEDGDVSSVRGITGTNNKSNNFDLARDTNSYNNYYGILSYINNQVGFDITAGDSSYNTDSFRGSVAYSIFQTNYNAGEVYKAFTSYEDASSYHTDSVDVAFSGGSQYEGLSDASFEKLDPINAKCESASALIDLAKYHTDLRNSDYSVNIGDLLKVKDPTLLTYANGSQIGANLSKTSYDEYNHYDVLNYDANGTENQAKVQLAYNALEILGDPNAIYQDFEIAKLINGCDITWKSSNPAVAEVLDGEKISVSNSVYGNVQIHTPATDTKVTLTASIRYRDIILEKNFEINVKSRNQTLGEMVSTGLDAIRVDIYSSYTAPRVYPLDSSSNTVTEMPLSTYELEYSYAYATDRKSSYYMVDGVYTSVPGVYHVTVTATLKSNVSIQSSYSYNVYVVDPDCNIDFLNQDADISLNKDGFTISGEVSNMYGDIYALVSNTAISNLTKDALIANENTQKIAIDTESINATFLADNTTQQSYYVYYVITNKNNSNENAVRTFQTNIQTVSTLAEFKNLATTGRKGSETPTTTTIYNLQNDLDFAGYNWTIVAKANLKSFTSLFNGNGHTIKNISVSGSSADKNVNIFYKVENGTIMNVNFEEISIENTNSASGKQVGIVGELQGGYLHYIKMKNISAKGREGIAALVGQVTGGRNYISQCSLINENTEEKTYVISAVNKYAGGIVGNAQKNSDQSILELTVTNCYVNAYIGDGEDAGGNTGGIIGRVKNESSVYRTVVESCYFVGTVQGKGNYNAGIVGDFDNGAGYVRISNNYADVVIILSGTVLDAEVAASRGDTQHYAHKNSNPIVGRAVISEGGVYESANNIGTWVEYYSDLIRSVSIVFDLSQTDDETGETTEWRFTRQYLAIRFDLDNIWEFDEEAQTLTLR